MRTVELRQERTDAQKVKKFNLIERKLRNQVKNCVNEQYGYTDIFELMGEEVGELVFGKRIFKILNEDKRGEYFIRK